MGVKKEGDSIQNIEYKSAISTAQGLGHAESLIILKELERVRGYARMERTIRTKINNPEPWAKGNTIRSSTMTRRCA